MDSQYRAASDLDTAWTNFEPDVPLKVGRHGENHPFYVERPDRVMSRLKRRLLRQSHIPPKYFLSGHRGCGKSTELYRLAANADIVGKYWPVHFSIQDHADLARAHQIFIHQQDILRQPNCAIVYTVSSSLFYDPTFPAARIETIFLPNISLYERGHRQRPSGEAYILNQFVLRRMVAKLIAEDALALVINLSGGVFRELNRLLRASIDFALDADRDQINGDDVAQAAVEIRNTYRRVLTQEQMAVLQAIYTGKDRQDPEIMAPLLQMLAVLEYNGDGTWFDIHPVLLDLIQTTGEASNDT